jgi:hypothetical protein
MLLEPVTAAPPPVTVTSRKSLAAALAGRLIAIPVADDVSVQVAVGFVNGTPPVVRLNLRLTVSLPLNETGPPAQLKVVDGAVTVQTRLVGWPFFITVTVNVAVLPAVEPLNVTFRAVTVVAAGTSFPFVEFVVRSREAPAAP